MGLIMPRFLCARLLAAALILVAVAVGQASRLPAQSPPPDGGKSTPAEIEMGKQASAQIEKEHKLVDDPAAGERIQRIVARLAPHTERPAIEYQVKIAADQGVNAFSLPGGYIYVTQGLLAAVESEDELAAVIAHEMAHVCLKHGMDLARREAKMNNQMALAVLAAVMAGERVDPGNMLLLGSLLKTGLLNGYSQQAENQADARAVAYLQRAGYRPVAVLTVIEGLARMQLTHPAVDLGIFRTHPYPQQRALAVRGELVKLGVDLNPRAVLGTLRTKAETVEIAGRAIARVSVDDCVIFEPAAAAEGFSPQQRAEKIAADLRRLLLDNLAIYEVRVVKEPSGAVVMARGERLIVVVTGDAEFHKAAAAELAAKAAANIKLALWQETVRRAY